jgi:periplasmic divalent cation tolerance protein
MRTPVLILTTLPAGFDARALARELVDARVAACVNVVERVVSVYRWEGKVTEDDEQLLVIKTAGDRIDDLRRALFARHPYEVPEFVALPVESTAEAYGAWLLDAVGRPPQ